MFFDIDCKQAQLSLGNNESRAEEHPIVKLPVQFILFSIVTTKSFTLSVAQFNRKKWMLDKIWFKSQVENCIDLP
jgi:hypothetical protein